MEKDINKILDKEFWGKLKNKGIKNDTRYLILFSGIPRSGKSILAQEIEKKYKGVRIKKDDARNVIYKNVEITDTKQTEEILDKYLNNKVEEIASFPNKLIIWNASVDRRFDEFADWAGKHNFKMFVIRMDTSLEIIKHRIDTELDASTAKWYHASLKKWETDHKNYTATGQVDFTVKNNSKEDIRELFNRLDNLLKKGK